MYIIRLLKQPPKPTRFVAGFRIGVDDSVQGRIPAHAFHVEDGLGRDDRAGGQYRQRPRFGLHPVRQNIQMVRRLAVPAKVRPAQAQEVVQCAVSLHSTLYTASWI
jgi:hypothetical protein